VRKTPQVPWVALVALAVGVAALASFCRAHGPHNFKPRPLPNPTPVPTPAPPPAKPYETITYERIYPPRWSWIHWWEANRDPYLRAAAQGTVTQGPGVDTIETQRAKSAESLLKALEIKKPEMRSSAALALGRIGEPTAVDRLGVLASRSDKVDVAIAAVTALGLLDSPEAEKVLVDQKYADEVLREAGMIALGLKTTNAADVVANLQKAVTGKEAGAATVAAWALRRRADPANKRFLRRVLKNTESPWLASEAVLSLGYQGDLDAAALLVSILLAGDEAKELPVWKFVAAMKSKESVYTKYPGSTIPSDAYKDYKKQRQQWWKVDPNEGAGRSTVVTVGLSDIYEARLRGSAAIALGLLDSPASRRALIACLGEDSDGYDSLFKGFAIMALGRFGEPEALPILFDILAEKKPRAKRKFGHLTETLRGYAALSLGFYARPRQTPQGLADCAGTDKVLERLVRTVADRKDTLEVRCAATVALGLSGRTSNLKPLYVLSKTIRRDEGLLVGYSLMARAMLGDQNVLDLTRRFLARAKPKTEDVSELLAQRAAVTALGLTRSREAVPLLCKAWYLNYHVQREVAMAFSLNESYGVADELIRLMQTSSDIWERVYDAHCLGELFCKRPQRLAWLINDSNYMMRNTRLLRHGVMANSFLYDRLISVFGSDWR
jgi:HEAT repeat protein